MAAHKTHHVADYKKDTVKEIKKLIEEYPIIAAINMENMPTAQLQKMRQHLRDKVVLLMTKRRLMKIAIDESKDVKKSVEEMNKHLKGMPALMFTKENPFKLYKMLQKSKTNAPAKPGQIAPKDILIQAGATPFAPGPVISELSMIGLKTGVEGGKVAIKQDKVVVKKGEEINGKVASILLRLGITPMEIGLDLVAAYENGTIFTKDVLAIDEKEFMQKIVNADAWAFNLGVEIQYPAVRILEYMIGKAFNESKALVLGQNIMCSLVAEDLLSKAEREMLSLKEAAKITKEAPKEEVKEEEPKKEVKPKKPIVEEKKEEPKPKIKEEVAIKEKALEKRPIEKKPIKEEPVEEEKKQIVKEPIKKIEKKKIIKEEEKPEVKEIPKEKVEKAIKEEVKVEEPPEEKIEEPKVEVKEEVAVEKEATKKIKEEEKTEEETTDEKVKKMVEKMRKREPTADELIKDEEKKEVIEEKKEELPKVDNLVKKTKDFVEGKRIKAEDLVAEEAKKAGGARAVAEEIVKRIQKGEQIKKEDIPSIQELVEKKKKEKKS